MEIRRSYRVASNGGSYVVDGRASEVTSEGGDGKRIRLKPTDFEVLYQIVQREGMLIQRHEFLPWSRVEEFADRRHPVDMAIVEIRRQLGDSIIETERGKGYRLSRRFSVEMVSGPSLSELEQLLVIAIAQLNMHSSAGFRASIKNSEELLKQRKVADASTAIAAAYINLGHVGFCREPWGVSIQKAREVLAFAIDQFPRLGSAYALRGLTFLIHDYAWEEAEVDLKQAFEHSPDNIRGHLLAAHMRVARGLFDEGLAHARRAAELDYQNPMHAITVPWFTLHAGRIAEAVTTAQKIADRFSESAPVKIIYGHCCLAAGATDKALQQYDLALSTDFLPDGVAGRGFVFGQMGRRKEAMDCLEMLRQAKEAGTIVYVSGFHEALIYAGLGDNQKALDALEKAFNEKCDWLIQIAVEPRWKTLRGEQRFQDLVRRVIWNDASATLR